MTEPRTLPLALCLLSALAAAPPSSAETVSLSVSGNQASGVISLPGGIGADLTITFEDSSGLAPASLEVSAELVSPLDPSLPSRLPAADVGIPGAFPVLIRIDPAPGSSLSFRGSYSVFIRTANLNYLPGSPLALASATGGGAFRDITTSLSSGSVRAGGTKGTFSDFLLVADTRGINAIIAEKYDALQETLDANAGEMPTDVAADLLARLDQSRASWDAGNAAAAITALDGFAETVLTQSGAAIPDLWAAGSGQVSVAGLLRAGAATLRFSLNRKLTGTP